MASSNNDCKTLQRAFPTAGILDQCCGMGQEQPDRSRVIIRCNPAGSMTELYLEYNGITGPIPDTLQDLKSLVHFLTGPIPDFISSFPDLIDLALNDNHLEGSIPSSLNNLTKLQKCYLGNNILAGPIPNYDRMNDLVVFDVKKNNYFEGQIPAGTGSFIQIRNNCYNSTEINIILKNSNSTKLDPNQKSESDCNNFKESSKPTNSRIDGSGSTVSTALIVGITLALCLVGFGAFFGFLYRKHRKEQQKALSPATYRPRQSEPEEDSMSLSLGNRTALSSNESFVAEPNAIHIELSEKSNRSVGSLFGGISPVSDVPSSDYMHGYRSQIPQTPNPRLERVPSFTLSYAELKSSHGTSRIPSPTFATSPSKDQSGATLVYPSKSGYSGNVEPYPPETENESSTSNGKQEYSNIAVPPRGVSRAFTVVRTETINAKPLSSWSIQEVAQWLYNDIGVRPDVVDRLQAFKLDGRRLVTLTETDLMAMGVHQSFVRTSILAAIGDGNSSPAGSSSDRLPPYTGLAENGEQDGAEGIPQQRPLDNSVASEKSNPSSKVIIRCNPAGTMTEL
ncbi:hypothetical protein HDU97_008468 [Phlyctochytrium planicorne]|nr:hypothetical protein HDU97_008468 [Phlyctochytrium planicorne]